VCNFLGEDVWSNTIIAITHCDTLPPEILDRDIDGFIANTKKKWIKIIHEKLQKLVAKEALDTSNVQIAFTSHTRVPECKAEPNWKQKLFETLLLSGKLGKSVDNEFRKMLAQKNEEKTLTTSLLPKQVAANVDHFLMIGRSGAGKSCLAGVLIKNKSVVLDDENASDSGTKFIKTTKVTTDSNTYHIHETKSLEDRRVDLNEMKPATKQVYDDYNCLVIVCIRWDDRYNDYNNAVALEVCNSLGDDVWSKAIIAVTHSDIIPPGERNKDEFIRNTKEKWKEVIKDELTALQVQSDFIQNVQICFTSHTEIPEYQVVVPKWWVELSEALTATSKLDRLNSLEENVQEKSVSQLQMTQEGIATKEGNNPNGAFIYVYKKSFLTTDEKLKIFLASIENKCDVGKYICEICENIAENPVAATAAMMFWLYR
jgi:GTPase SAR1 family protein